MFKTDGEFNGLDEFYHTDSPNHMLSKEAIAERTNGIVALYKDWELHSWKFSNNDEDRNEIQQDCLDVIEHMRDSANSYSLGMFVSTIQLSSAAVERLINTVLFLKKKERLSFLKDHKKIIQTPPAGWIQVNTVAGPRYYTSGFKSRIYRKGNGFVEFRPRVLDRAIGELRRCRPSFKVDSLCEEGSPKSCVFVDRRNAAAHGTTTRLHLIEQFHGYIINKTDDWYPLINNQYSALNQYRLASAFIINAFSIFTKRYGYFD